MEFRSIDSLIIDTLITQLSDDGRRPQTKGFSGAPMSNQFFIFFILFRNLSTARYRTLFLMRNLKSFEKKKKTIFDMRLLTFWLCDVKSCSGSPFSIVLDLQPPFTQYRDNLNFFFPFLSVGLYFNCFSLFLMPRARMYTAITSCCLTIDNVIFLLISL